MVRAVEWGGLFVVLLLATYLRFDSPGVVEFKRDEANLSQLALDMATGDTFPVLGIGSSVGFPNAPWNVYILAVPYAISSSPVVATGFIALLNLVAVTLTYIFARHYTNVYIALLVTLLFAVNPWAVIFARKIWAQNMLPLFAILTVGTGLAGFVHNKRWGQWSHLPLLAITGQIHYGAFVMIPTTLYLLYQGRKKITRAFWFSLIIVGLLTLPYLVGLSQANLLTPRAISDAISTSDSVGESLHFSLDSVRGAGLMIAGTEIHSLAGPEMFLDYLDSVPDAYSLFNIVAWMVLASAVWLVIRAVFRPDSRTVIDITLLIWLVFPVIAYLVNWTPFFIHYLTLIFPAVFLVLGFALHDLWQGLAEHNVVRYGGFAVGGVLIATVVVLQIWLYTALTDFVDRHPTPGGFGTPLHYLMDVREMVLEDRPGQVIGTFSGQAIGIDEQPTIWHALLDGVPEVRFTDPTTQVYPADSAVYLTDDCDDTFVTQQITLRGDAGCYGVGERGDPDLDDYTVFDTQPHFANGVNLVAYRYADSCLSLVWHITQRTSQDYMFAVQFFDESGARIGNADGLSWFGRYWLPGDTVIRRLCAVVLNGTPVELRIGMYTYDGINFDNIELPGGIAGQLYSIRLDQ